MQATVQPAIPPPAQTLSPAKLMVFGGLLVVLQLYVNRPILEYDWVYFDDDINILLNPQLTGLEWDGIIRAWTSFDSTSHYMPLGWMFFDSLFLLGGLEPTVYHAASWLLAAATTLLLFAISRRLAKPAAARTWNTLATFLGVALLSVHPWRAEIIGWCSGLLYLAASFLALLATLLVLPSAGEEPGQWRRLTGVACYTGSLLVYPIAFPLPLLLIARSLWCETKGETVPWYVATGSAVRTYASWLFAAAACGLLNLFAAAQSGTGIAPIERYKAYPLSARLEHAAASFGHYANSIFSPGQTSPSYVSAYDWNRQPPWHYLTWGFLLLAGLGLFHRRLRKPLSLLLAVPLVSLLPFLGLFYQNQEPNDRYTIWLLACLAIAVGACLARLESQWARLSATLGIIALLGTSTLAYQSSLAVWRNTETLQARLDAATAHNPSVRLSYSRPAVQEFLRGRYVNSERLLREGYGHFGPTPSLQEAANYISAVHRSLPSDGHYPVRIPYVQMHLDLAVKHQSQGHDYAARVHLHYAEKLASTPLR